MDADMPRIFQPLQLRGRCRFRALQRHVRFRRRLLLNPALKHVTERHVAAGPLRYPVLTAFLAEQRLSRFTNDMPIVI